MELEMAFCHGRSPSWMAGHEGPGTSSHAEGSAPLQSVRKADATLCL